MLNRRRELIAAASKDGNGGTVYNYGPWADEEGLPQPQKSLNGLYPTKLLKAGNGSYGPGETVWKNQWQTNGIVETYSNAEKRFTVGGKHFILLDTDAEGNYFVIADELYGSKAFVTTPQVSSSNANWRTSAWFQAHLNGTWIYDPNNDYSIAKWLNTTFLTSGNGAGNKLPDAIISNLVEKEWGVEGGSQMGDTYFYQNTDPALAEPIYTSVAPYKVTQKVSLLSAYEYYTYWQDISPLAYGVEASSGWAPAKEWWLRTAANNPVSNNNGGGNGLCVYHTTGQYLGANSYNFVGVRPCFWLDKDFFVTENLTM